LLCWRLNFINTFTWQRRWKYCIKLRKFDRMKRWLNISSLKEFTNYSWRWLLFCWSSRWGKYWTWFFRFMNFDINLLLIFIFPLNFVNRRFDPFQILTPFHFFLFLSFHFWRDIFHFSIKKRIVKAIIVLRNYLVFYA